MLSAVCSFASISRSVRVRCWSHVYFVVRLMTTVLHLASPSELFFVSSIFDLELLSVLIDVGHVLLPVSTITLLLLDCDFLFAI